MKIVVIGDSCVDQYIYGKSSRLCPDAPVPVLIPTKTVENGGMAKNVHANILSLGIECNIITNTEKIVKTRYVHEHTNHMFIRIDTNEEKIKRISPSKLANLSSYDAVVISDYNKGFLREEDIQKICQSHPLVFMDTKKPLGPWASDCNYIKINEKEYEHCKEHYGSLDTSLAESLIVTLGPDGCRYKDDLFPVARVDVKDMSGAGDTFLSGLVVEFLYSRDIKKAIDFANVCATQVVQKKGVVTIDEV
jgi:D-glycero-beta-D-manno-heptose-7-phosphate kinase|tara:strand:+ start:14322 stop:15068 length:747 start_codon:yes stop_codon:yes gene_type:complete